jgi:hypothetical protein
MVEEHRRSPNNMVKFTPGTLLNGGIIERVRRRRGAPPRALVRNHDGTTQWMLLPAASPRTERLAWRIGDRFETHHADEWKMATIVARRPGTPPRFLVRYATGESYWALLPQLRVGDEWLFDPKQWK